MTQSVTGGRSRSREPDGSGTQSLSAIVEHGIGDLSKALLGFTLALDHVASPDAFGPAENTRSAIGAR